MNRELGAPVAETDTYTGMPHEQAEDAQAQAEQLLRRLADQRLRDELARSDFTGRQYRRFEHEIVRYGLSVQRGWMYSGSVFRLAAARGYWLEPTDRELEQLRRDPELRDTLANSTVARALPYFRKHALLGGRWSADGGASLPTYFVGATLYEFPNQFRAWRAQRERWRRQDHGDYTANGLGCGHVSDPAILAVGDLWVQDTLAQATPREREIVELSMGGYTQDEIVEMLLTETSVRAVEGVLYRWRTAVQQQVERQERRQP